MENEKPKQGKGSRPDVAKKQQKAKGDLHVVIKASLRKHILGDEEFKTKIVDAIHLYIDEYSKSIVLASRALSLLLKEYFEKGKKLPNIFNQTFVRQMMLGVEEAKKPQVVVKKLFERHPELLHGVETHPKGCRNVYSHAAKKYITNVKNSLKMNFLPRLKKYLKLLEKAEALTQPEKVHVLYAIMGWSSLPKDVQEMNIQERKHVVNIITEQRRILGLEKEQEITEGWFKHEENLKAVLKQWVFFNRLEGFYMPFDIVPISKVRHHFVTIDNETFLGMLVEAGVIEVASSADASLLWPSIFKTDALQGRGKTFTGTIDTDGVSICFHYTSPKPPKLTPEQQKALDAKTKAMFQDPSTRKLGCDPGRANIYTIVEILSNGKIKSYTLTRKQYYNDSGVFDARKQTETWTKGILKNLDAVSKVTTKGVSVIRHLAYLKVFLENLEILWQEYTKKHWADQRLRLYGGKKRTLDRFMNRVLGPETKRQKTVVAYGAAKFAPGGKGEISVPTSGAYNAMKKQKDVTLAPTDEFRSSKVDYKTDQLLKTVVQVPGFNNDYPLRGLLWCDSTIKDSKQGTFVNRDVNAALNILRCAMLSKRPKILDRKLAKTRLPKQEIGKVLKKT